MKHIPFSAQPANEALLADRALHWVLGTVYNQKGAVSSGPVSITLTVPASSAAFLRVELDD